MMEKVLTAEEVVAMGVARFINNPGEMSERSLREGHRTLVTSGSAYGDRPATFRVSVSDEQMSVLLMVPGGGDYTYNFRIWEDEATEARINRWLDRIETLNGPK